MRKKTLTSEIKKKKKLSDQEIWEQKQILQAIGQDDLIVKAEEGENENYDPNIDKDHEEDLDIEIVEEKPFFLQNHTIYSRGNFNSIKIVKNPDGSMGHAAMIAQALAVERRDMRLQLQKHETDVVPDLSKNWNDPSSCASDRRYYNEMERMGRQEENLSEWKKSLIGQNFSLGVRITKTMKQQREGLPIYKLKAQLLQAIIDHDLIIVVGQTGSGKTTQMTQYLSEIGYASLGRIGCTQPRRVAAISVAKRVAEEYGCRVGQEIGYAIRFEDCTSNSTKIKYMTDGMLLRETLLDENLFTYSVIILDEAHERTIHTDVLFALTKECCIRRNSKRLKNRLKLIITSATLDAEAFSKYFCNCPIFTIPGRTFPVSIMYSKQEENDYVEAALITAMNIHLTEPPGDILIFLTGKEEIDNACELLYDRIHHLKDVPPMFILPLYSALSSEQQTRIFEPAPIGTRKCIIGTNIAEASLTIDGIYFVVDPGFVKQQVYNPKLRMNSLKIVPISQQSADQRAGRAGRTGPGKCYRLYTQIAFRNEMFKSQIPEIQRTNLGNVVLMLKAMSINDILNFDFMDKPGIATLVVAMHQLFNLGALDEEGMLTRHGRQMAEFPLEPQLSKVLIKSVDLKCAYEIVSVIAMLQTENIFHRPKHEQSAADIKRNKFNQQEGDQVTYLEVYNQWVKNNYSNSWCSRNFINSKSLKKAQDVRKQLIAIMERYGLPLESCGRDVTRLQQAMCSGFFQNISKKDLTEGYRTLIENQACYIHPSSSLFHHQPQWCVFFKILFTSREYMRDVLVIEPQWLIDLAPNFFRKTDVSKISRIKQCEKIEPLFKHGEQDGSWRISRVIYQDK